MSLKSLDSHKLAYQERLEYLRKIADLSDEELKIIAGSEGVSIDSADRMIENVVGGSLDTGWVSVRFCCEW